jgi:hypothetical protein
LERCMRAPFAERMPPPEPAKLRQIGARRAARVIRRIAGGICGIVTG